jgi:methionyl-tRNA formyltransferase
MKNRIIFCAYRKWAIDVYESIKVTYSNLDFYLAENQSQLVKLLSDSLKPNYIICVGWSWLVPDKIIDDYLVVGIHPSNLPDFAGGSPIQHQISEGITNTKNSLFRLTKNIDSGPVLAKVDLSLEGSLDNVFTNLTSSSIQLISLLLDGNTKKADSKNEQKIKSRKRLTEQDGNLSVEDFNQMSALELYNFMRCREDPYPNAYFEDNTGRLWFSGVKFQQKKDLK